MTLIIGVKCQDGIVIGADSITTYGSPLGGSTIEQEVRSKIEIEQGDIVLATAGPVGLNQLMKAELSNNWSKIKRQRQVKLARTEISKVLWKQVAPAIERASVAKKLYGEGAAGSVFFASLIALPILDKHVLLLYGEQADSTEFSFDLPIVTVGSGQLQADPFLAFVKRIMWNDKHPNTIEDGILGVLWTLQHVIRVNAGHGVGGEPTIATLQRLDGQWEADRLTGARLDQQRQKITGAEKTMRHYLTEFASVANSA